ncbi:MAG: glycosyl hydrolase family 18 protein [Desulfosporosinus sp.]|jgi:spore germination protein
MPLKVFVFYNGLTEQTKGYPYHISYGNLFNQLALHKINIQDHGTLLGRPRRRLINEAHALGIKVFLMVSNLTSRGQFSSALVEKLVRDQCFANIVWQNIKNILDEYQCDGVNFDLQRVAPGDKPLFSKLISNWSERFQRENYLVSINLPAKTSNDLLDDLEDRRDFFDYTAIGQAVDEVIITSEEHRASIEPGAVASFPWFKRVLNYAVTNIPPGKIFMEIPIYGLDWPEQGVGQIISYQQAIELARRHGAPLQWDAGQHSTYFRYEIMRERHTVYFEDPRSMSDKLDIALQLGIRGIALCKLNLSYTSFWDVLQTYV